VLIAMEENSSIIHNTMTLPKYKSKFSEINPTKLRQALST
jgi:hypothetical protein